jgi:Kef-type K+ transport system membrane component KefB
VVANGVVILFVDLAAIIVLARLLGAVAARLGQPAVIGEVLAGVFVLPLAAHGFADAMFQPSVRDNLTALANVGVALFMFIVGMELDWALMRGRGRVAVSVAVAAMVLPFGLGVALGGYLASEHGGDHGARFAVFMGVACAITAFPVLARILTDQGMRRTPVGNLALTCAAIGDVLAWLVLAAVVASIGGPTNPAYVALVAPYLLAMFGAVRPALRWLAGRQEGGLGLLAAVVTGVLLSGAFTELIGLHFIFGAFMFGVVMPREGGLWLRTYVHDRLSELNSVLLMPVFFIVAGLKADLSAFDAGGLGVLALILLVAISGKFVGAFATARLYRLPARESATLGVLMNTRGLTELIVLSVGLQLGLLDTTIYTLMVVMVIVATAMAGPLLRLCYPPAHIARDSVPPEPVSAVVRAGRQGG